MKRITSLALSAALLASLSTPVLEVLLVQGLSVNL